MASNEQTPEWLPRGWEMVSKTRVTGKRVDKEYFSPDGLKFRSKKSIIQYLKTLISKDAPIHLNENKISSPISSSSKLLLPNESIKRLSDQGCIDESKYKKIRVTDKLPAKDFKLLSTSADGLEARKTDSITELGKDDLMEISYPNQFFDESNDIEIGEPRLEYTRTKMRANRTGTRKLVQSFL